MRVPRCQSRPRRKAQLCRFARVRYALRLTISFGTALDAEPDGSARRVCRFRHAEGQLDILRSMTQSKGAMMAGVPEGRFLEGIRLVTGGCSLRIARRAYEGGVPPEQFSAEQVRLATFELEESWLPDRGRGSVRLNRLEAAFINRRPGADLRRLRVRLRAATASLIATTPYPRSVAPRAVSVPRIRTRTRL